jgi:hypothetical protein
MPRKVSILSGRARSMKAVQSEYARLAGMFLAALKAATELYLPILRALALASCCV